MDPIRFTIGRSPTTKKNSPRIFYVGARCPRCKKGDRPIVSPSEDFADYERAVAPPLQRRFAELRGGAAVTCTNCKGTGRKRSRPCLRCLGAGRSAQPIEVPVLVEARIYRARNLGDLSGYLDAIGDVLQTAGVVANDRQIQGWPMPTDGALPLRLDPARPRVELVITPLAPEELQAPLDFADPDDNDPPDSDEATE